MINFFKKAIIKKIVRNLQDKPLFNPKSKNFIFLKDLPKYNLHSFGKKNPKKIFYVIKIDKAGGGIFSNLLFVLNHLKLCEKFKLIPVIDMENFYTKYNEKKPLKNNKNSWLYYFKKVSKYNLNEVYKSKNVLMTDGFFSPSMTRSYKNDSNLKNIFKKYIKIKSTYINNTIKFAQKNFYGKKVLGVHFRGTDMKVIPSHPLPPTPKQMFYIIDKLIEKKKFTKIFIATEQLKYLKMFKKKYGELICYRDSFRSDQNKIFDLKNRKNHRYETGRDSMEEMLLLSKLEYLVCSRSSVSELAIMLSKKPISYFEIDNGINSSSILYSQFKWLLKSILPEYFGGFINKINIKFKKKFFK